MSRLYIYSRWNSPGQSLAYSGNYLLSRGIMDEYDVGSSNYLQIDLTKTMSGRNIYSK